MSFEIHTGDCLAVLREMAPESVHCCVTSPPYFGLRDYEIEPTFWPEVEFVPAPGLPPLRVPAMRCCLGLEPDPWSFVAHQVLVFRELRRVLREDGTLWLNLGDSYAGNGAAYDDSSSTLQGSKQINRMGARRAKKAGPGLKAKDLIGIPWRVAFALQADGWYLRQDIIWSKPNPMPESVRDRCTKAHEYLFLLSKSPRYYFDYEAIKEPVAEATRSRLAQTTLAEQAGSCRVPGKNNGNMKAVGNSDTRNKRSVWNVTTKPFKGEHFATFPPALIEPCILAGCPVDGTVLDPFGGAGTTALVADELGRNSKLIEINPDFSAMSFDRLLQHSKTRAMAA